jgi:FAD/FMN-containing dehydrogenase
MANALHDLTAHLGDAVLRPGEPAAEQECAGYNTAVRHAPLAVVRARSHADVVAAVRVANHHRLHITVHATGHGTVTGTNGGVLISTRRLDHLAIDPLTRIATIGAGVRWDAVIAAAARHGLAPVGGSSGSVGVVGYLLGGGLGPLARSHGFGSDHVIGITVVTGTGELLEVDGQHHGDLFWALRGGKHGLGVVVALRLRLIPLATLYGGSLWFDAPQIERALRGWIEWTRTAHPDATTSVAILRLPLIDAVPRPLRGRHLLSLRFAYAGALDEGECLAAPLRALAPLHHDDLAALPAAGIARIHGDPEEPGPQWVRGQLLDAIDQRFATALLSEVGIGTTSPFAVEVRQLGNATSRDVVHGSAVGGRPAAYAFALAALDLARDAAVVSPASERLLDVLQPWACRETTINFTPVARSPEHLASAWPPAIHRRLRTIRERYDPTGGLT